jgi:hypothetical protein
MEIYCTGFDHKQPNLEQSIVENKWNQWNQTNVVFCWPKHIPSAFHIFNSFSESEFVETEAKIPRCQGL